MCVIAICDKRRLTKEEAAAMWRANDHGAGVAWASKGLVKFRKGFMAYKDFAKFYFGAALPFPHIVHFRISTAGGVVPELTHPFPCSKNAETALHYSGKTSALFQNGCLRDWAVYVTTIAKASDQPLLGPVSDARVLALIKYYVPSILPSIAPGKLAILSADGKVETLGAFDNLKGGVRVSNKYWSIKARVSKQVKRDEFDRIIPTQYFTGPGWAEEQRRNEVVRSLGKEWDTLGVHYGD
jgi:hypothetical protein